MGATCSSSTHTTIDLWSSSTTSLDCVSNDAEVIKILIVGPSLAGKSHLINRWIHGTGNKCDINIPVPQTQGFNTETMTSKSGNIFTMWEISGQPYMRYKRRHLYYGSQAVVYVVRNCNSEMEYWQIVQEDINTLLQEKDLYDVPLLVVVNKIAQSVTSNSSTLPVDVIKLKLDLQTGERKCDFVEVDFEQPGDIDNALNTLESLFVSTKLEVKK